MKGSPKTRRVNDLRLTRNCRLRTERGSGIVLSIGGIWLLVGGIVIGCLTLVNLGAVAYYKERLAFVANQAASYGAGFISWCGSTKPGASPLSAQSSTAPLVSLLLADMGMPAASKFTLSQNGGQIATAVGTQGLATIGVAPFLPLALSLESSGSKNIFEDAPPGVMSLYLEGRLDTRVVLPVYGKFLVPWSNGGALQETAPVGTAVFRNFRFTWDQYNISLLPGTLGENH